MKRSMLLALVVLLAGCDASSGAPQADSSLRHITSQIFGCQQLETAQRVSQLIASGDKVASLDFVRGELASGECSELSKGAEVSLEDARLDGLAHVRPKGSSMSYWTIREVVGP